MGKAIPALGRREPTPEDRNLQMEEMLAVLYMLVGLGLALQFWERGTKLLGSISAGIMWPLVFGLAIGDIAHAAIKESYAQLGKPQPGQRV
jgi:hypothetical protein